MADMHGHAKSKKFVTCPVCPGTCIRCISVLYAGKLVNLPILSEKINQNLAIFTKFELTAILLQKRAINKTAYIYSEVFCTIGISGRQFSPFDFTFRTRFITPDIYQSTISTIMFT